MRLIYNDCVFEGLCPYTENEKSLFTGYMGSVQYVSENKETFIEVYSEFK